MLHPLSVSPAATLRFLSSGGSITEALYALIDNAVQAGASNVWVRLVRRTPSFGDSKKNNVAAYEIVDDGAGMDAAGLAAALSLAAGPVAAPGSLSKFGLGLKAAAFSQGERLELISSPGGAPFRKLILSIPEVEAAGRYFARPEPLSEEDEALVAELLPGGRGTIVRVGEVRMENHPSIKDTLDELRYKAGVVYFYFLRDGALTLHVEGAPIPAYDPLWTAEADANGNLDESTWDGKQTRWIKKPGAPLVLDEDARPPVEAIIEVTQLPHPPTFELEQKGLRAQVRDRYRIEAGNYGYYVYRNRRLIAWAEGFGGLVPQNQDYYAFRGRILINEAADEVFHIDVKKANLNLSDTARRFLGDLSADYRRKSREAWQKVSQEYVERSGENPNEKANELAAAFKPDEEPEGITTPQREQDRNAREAAYRADLQEQAREEAARKKAADTGQPVEQVEVTPDEVQAVVKGDANPAAHHIFRVERIDEDVLWAPYLDADQGRCVRINRHHWFARLVFDNNSDNTALQVIFELLLFQLALAEGRTVRQVDDLKREDVERVLRAFRRYASGYLADLYRTLETQLPPYKPGA